MVNPTNVVMFFGESSATPTEEAVPVLSPLEVESPGCGAPMPVSRSSPPIPPPPPPRPSSHALPDLFPWSDTFAFYHSLLNNKVTADAGRESMTSISDDQPLDLSFSRSSPSVSITSRVPRKLEPPTPTNKKPYTEEELQAALRDIQSGRLGTRRAAVIYGIPRSTLRNKVYRLVAQEKRAEAERLPDASKETPPPLPTTTSDRPVVEPEPEPGSVCRLLQAHLSRPLEPAEPIRAIMSWMYSGVLQRALLAREPAGPRAHQPPVWDDFVRRMSHERFHEVLTQLRAVRVDCAVDEGTTPAQPPPPLPPHSRITPSAGLNDNKSGTDTPSPPAARKRKLVPHVAELSETNNNTPVKGATNLAAKGSRPKRGKYRNYNRSHLADAVRAVQSGEMSVHRAGNFYGVPHSTLEYKVKQRHLDRGGKRERAVEWRPACVSPAPVDKVATSGGVMTYSEAASPLPPAGSLLPSDALRRLQEGVAPFGDTDDSGSLDRTTLARLLGDGTGGDLAVSVIATNLAHTAGGQVLQTTQSS